MTHILSAAANDSARLRYKLVVQGISKREGFRRGPPNVEPAAQDAGSVWRVDGCPAAPVIETRRTLLVLIDGDE